MIVRCTVKDCIWNYDERCEAGEITISDEELRADGFYPRCSEYEVREDDKPFRQESGDICLD